MISDVPLGAFLSGAVWTPTVVVARWRTVSAEPVKTFWIGFAAPSSMSGRLARLVAQRFATDHHELVVEPSAIEIAAADRAPPRRAVRRRHLRADLLPGRMARRHVTVALNGDGGDEAFGGYTRYQAALLASRLD